MHQLSILYHLDVTKDILMDVLPNVVAKMISQRNAFYKKLSTANMQDQVNYNFNSARSFEATRDKFAGSDFFSSVVYVMDSLDGEARVFLDPNTLSEDGTTAVSSKHYTKDGSLCAIASVNRDPIGSLSGWVLLL